MLVTRNQRSAQGNLQSVCTSLREVEMVSCELPNYRVLTEGKVVD